MSGTAGRNAVALPWLCPTTGNLVALAETPAELPRLATADPALLAFLVRYDPEPNTPFELSPRRLHAPRLPETAAAFLAHPAPWFDPESPAGAALVSWARTAGDHAARLARSTPDAARAAAVLAALGWYAVATVDPDAAHACLTDPELPANPATTQLLHWGMTHDAIARRLAARWRLPEWVATVIGHLSLPPETVGGLVADPELFAVVREAVAAADAAGPCLGLTPRALPGANLPHPQGVPNPGVFSPKDWHNFAPGSARGSPHTVALLPNLLRLAAESRRRTGAALALRLEDRIDQLHAALADQAAALDDRVREARLSGLAELAAGAGHEINNPLAVISGKAQFLLAMADDAERDPDPDRDEAARTIRRQAERVHAIIRELMTFARPPRPEPQRFPVAGLLAAARDELTDLATGRGVRVEVADTDAWADGDFAQWRRALAAVVRNGVEAAPPGGWVRLACADEDGRVSVSVEDSGPGVDPAHRESLFDPFFCGRPAGRRFGLGLPTAWRFARANGGDVRFDPTPGGPTRFVLTLSRAAGGCRPAGRKSA